jgi:hypothetical protein
MIVMQHDEVVERGGAMAHDTILASLPTDHNTREKKRMHKGDLKGAGGGNRDLLCTVPEAECMQCG